MCGIQQPSVGNNAQLQILQWREQRFTATKPNPLMQEQQCRGGRLQPGGAVGQIWRPTLTRLRHGRGMRISAKAEPAEGISVPARTGVAQPEGGSATAGTRTPSGGGTVGTQASPEAGTAGTQASPEPVSVGARAAQSASEQKSAVQSEPYEYYDKYQEVGNCLNEPHPTACCSYCVYE